MADSKKVAHMTGTKDTASELMSHASRQENLIYVNSYFADIGKKNLCVHRVMNARVRHVVILVH